MLIGGLSAGNQGLELVNCPSSVKVEGKLEFMGPKQGEAGFVCIVTGQVNHSCAKVENSVVLGHGGSCLAVETYVKAKVCVVSFLFSS